MNVEYFLSYGPKNERKNEKPFYNSLNSEIFNLAIIKDILDKDNIINRYNIDIYRFYDKNLNGFVKIDEEKDYIMPSENLILDLHFKEYIDQSRLDIDVINQGLTNEMHQMKNQIKYFQKNEEYDLIYLYASPIVNYSEISKPINYRSEIKNIIKLFNSSGKSFNCLFECANEKTFRDFIIKKKTKILHIAAHGDIDENGDYSLKLEDKGKMQSLNLEILENILKANSPKLKRIDLALVCTCHSEKLGILFKKYHVKNVIYIQSKNEISNIAALKFSEYFYEGLIKGLSIEDSFYKSQEKLSNDREVILINQNNCCCHHKHKKETEDIICKKIHNEFHKKICDCHFNEFHIHKINCKYHQKIINNDKYKFDILIDKEKDIVKICCCDHTINHCEDLKFIFEKQEDSFPFKYQKKGNLQINKNCCFFDFDENKNFSTIGREKKMEKIYNIITDNSGQNSHFIIVYGDKEFGKEDFCESVCVYLFERKLINKYEKIELKTEYDLEIIKNKILNFRKYQQDKKIIIIIKIYLFKESESFRFVNKILDEINIENSNLYYFIIVKTEKENIESEIKGKNKFEIISLKRDEESAKNLLEKLCKHYGCINNYNNLKEKKDELIKLVKCQQKKIEILSDLIRKYDDYNIIKKYIESKEILKQKEKNRIEQLLEKNDISKIYYLLSNMPSGLPNSILNLIYPDYFTIMAEGKRNINLIYRDPNDNWNYLYDFKKEIINYFKNKDKEKKEYISNCIEIYSKLLYEYIKKNKQNICFPGDSNIHYIFNSYNGTGIWKTFDREMYEYCFYQNHSKNKKEYETILNYEFDLEKHAKNIIYLIENNLEDINNLLKSEIIKEYIEQILIMLPSCYFLKKQCKSIVIKCKYLCKMLELKQSEQRLLLFLYSLEQDKDIDLNLFMEAPLRVEADFLNTLIKKDIKLFKEFIDKYSQNNITKTRINSNFNEIKLKLIYSYYEISGLHYSDSEKNKENAKEYLIKSRYNLIKAKNIAKEINDYFLINRINIDYFLLIKRLKEISQVNPNEKDNQKNIENLYSESFQFLDEVIHQKILTKELKLCFNEAYYLKLEYNKKLEPDIIILSSNPLKNYFSILDSGISSYHNNQYYLLEKLQEKIRTNIKIESSILNKNKLTEVLDKKGKILIIQSDDFTGKGEIIMETEKGESQLLSFEDLEAILPEKIKFDILILCFAKSEKIKKIFEDKVDNLITFDDINIYDLEKDTLLEYNKLNIDFLINFIEKITEISEKNEINIEKAFENAKENTLKGYNKINKFVSLKNNKIKTSIKYEKDKTFGKIFLDKPLLDLPVKASHFKYYSEEIFDLIKLILSEKKQFINIYLNNDLRVLEKNTKKFNKKTLIGIEIMKFFYRHQTFNKLYYVYNGLQYGNTLNEIFNKVLKNEKDNEPVNRNRKYTSFILINNYEKNYLSIEDPITLLSHVQYLIMSKKDIIFYNNEDDKFFKKRHKNKIMMTNKIPLFYQNSLIDHENKSKKDSKKNKNKKSKKDNENKEDKKDINIMNGFKSIFECSFESKSENDSLDKESDSDI